MFYGLTLNHNNHIYTDSKHLSKEKTFQKLYKYWFPNMSRNVRNYINICIKFKASKSKTSSKNSVTFHTKIFQPICGIQLSDKLSRKNDKNEYVLVLIDVFSKLISLYHINCSTSKQVVECFRILLTDLVHLIESFQVRENVLKVPNVKHFVQMIILICNLLHIFLIRAKWSRKRRYANFQKIF